MTATADLERVLSLYQLARREQDRAMCGCVNHLALQLPSSVTIGSAKMGVAV